MKTSAQIRRQSKTVDEINTRLIAAAHDMLNTLQLIARGACLEQINQDHCICYSCVAQKAVAKADGKVVKVK